MKYIRGKNWGETNIFYGQNDKGVRTKRPAIRSGMER